MRGRKKALFGKKSMIPHSGNAGKASGRVEEGKEEKKGFKEKKNIWIEREGKEEEKKKKGKEIRRFCCVLLVFP